MDDGVMIVEVGDSVSPLEVLRESVADSRAGAVVMFEGTTREVERLDYEAYTEMAVERIHVICQEELVRHKALKASVTHLTGSVPLGDASIRIMVSAAHRGEAFSAARSILDRIKQEAPIWKVEVDGADRRRVDGFVPANS